MAKATGVLHVLGERNNADDRGSKSGSVPIGGGPCGCKSELSPVRPGSCISCMGSKMPPQLNKRRGGHKKKLNLSDQRKKISYRKKKKIDYFLNF